MFIKACSTALLPLIIWLFCTSSMLQAQTIRYSRQTIPLPDYEKMQLIPDVSGNYHLLTFRRNNPISLFIFNAELQSTGKKELPIKVRDTCDTRIIPFKNVYLLYFHKTGSKYHELWQVDAAGKTSSLTGTFQKFIDTSFTNNTSTLHLVNQNEDLVFITHTYYHELKALTSTVIKVDKSFKTISTKTASFPYHTESDRLLQTVLVADNLFLLQSTENQNDFSLQLIKADLATGKIFKKSFNSNQDFSRDASFRFNTNDSCLLIQSLIGPQAFLCKLDFSLNEKVPAKLVSARNSSNAVNNFLLLNGDVQEWIALNPRLGRKSIGGLSTGTQGSMNYLQTNPYRNIDFGGSFPNDYLWGTARGFDAYTPLDHNNYSKRTPGFEISSQPFNFLITNKEFKIIKDSLVTNKKGQKTVGATEYATVHAGTNSFLILKQEFSRGEKGLLIASVDSNHQISTKDISVMNKIQYLLKEARTVQQKTVVMPYVQDYGVGLLRLSFADGE